MGAVYLDFPVPFTTVLSIYPSTHLPPTHLSIHLLIKDLLCVRPSFLLALNTFYSKQVYLLPAFLLLFEIPIFFHSHLHLHHFHKLSLPLIVLVASISSFPFLQLPLQSRLWGDEHSTLGICVLSVWLGIELAPTLIMSDLVSLLPLALYHVSLLHFSTNPLSMV